MMLPEGLSRIEELTEKLGGAEAMLESLFEQAPDGYVITDENGVIVMVNRMAECMFGYSRAELIGQAIEILVPEHLRDGHVCRRMEVCAEYLGEIRPMGTGGEPLGRHKNGSLVSLDIQHGPLSTNGSRFIISAVREVKV